MALKAQTHNPIESHTEACKATVGVSCVFILSTAMQFDIFDRPGT